MTILDELLVGLGFEYDPEEAKQFNKDIDKTVNIIKNLIKVAVAGATAITGLTIASTRATDEQGKLASEIGDTVENIDALQFALKRAGGTSEGMVNTLRQLAIRSAEAARGVGSGVEAFGLLGISVTDNNGNLKTTNDLMLEISQQFKGFGKAQQIELSDKLGIRDSILLLQQGPKAIRELTMEAEALGVTTKEDAGIAEEFQDSLTDLWQITKSISRTFSRILAPILKELTQQFTDWWKINREMIEQNLPKWIDDFTMSMKFLSIAIGAFLAFRFANHLVSLISLVKGLTGATLVLNAAVVLLPGLIFLSIAAILALIQDAKVFFEGGESFIGDMIKKFPQWGLEIGLIASRFNIVADITDKIFTGWSKIIDLFKSFSIEKFGEFIKTIPAFLGDVTGLYTPGGGGIIPELGNNISNSASTFVDKLEIVVQGGGDTAENIANSVFNIFQQTSQDLNSAVDI